VWDSLPRFVQEAFVDEGLAAYLEAFIQAEMTANVEVAQMEKMNFLTPDDDVVDTLEDFHETVVESRADASDTALADPSASVDLYLETTERWLGFVEDAGYDAESANWSEYVAEGGELPDFGPWLDLVRTEILEPHSRVWIQK
jgi:hypothetical protein